MANSKVYAIKKKTGKKAHKTEKADTKRPIVEKASSRRFRYLNRGFCKYDCKHVLPVSTGLRKNLCKWQI